MTKPLNKANSAAAKVTTSNGNGALNRLACRNPLFMMPKLNVCRKPRWHPSEVTAANKHAFRAAPNPSKNGTTKRGA